MIEQAGVRDREKVGILLVDDQAAIRQGLRMEIDLEPGVAVVGEARTAEEALTLASSLHPDMIVMNVEMPGMDGITATQILCAMIPRPTVLILTIHDDSETRSRAMAAGASVFIVKGRPEDLRVAIRGSLKSLKPG